MITKRLTVQTLKGLYQIAEAGEKGFATAAANMPSPALKVLFKIYAQQRLSFKNEIMGELRRFGTDTQPWMNLPGAVHRGRVGVYAGMSDSGSQERIILNEVVKGEKVAMRTYQKALALDLAAQPHKIVECQYPEINKSFACAMIQHIEMLYSLQPASKRFRFWFSQVPLPIRVEVVPKLLQLQRGNLKLYWNDLQWMEESRRLRIQVQIGGG
jgi:uncharacterized protein (TIGR02284 family)